MKSFFLVAGVVALVSTVKWYYALVRAKTFRPSPARQVLAIAPPLLVVVLLIVLQTLADPVYVAGKLDYTLLFTAGGITWMFVAASAFAWLGVSARDDALECGNVGAGLAIAGGMVGVIRVASSRTNSNGRSAIAVVIGGVSRRKPANGDSATSEM
jgi:hypothetical protein